MEPITIEVPAEYIGVLKLFASKDDVRYYLNGIALEVGPKESRIVATDGHRLGVFRIASEQPTVGMPFTVIIPIDMVEHVKPSKGPVTIEIEPMPEENNVHVALFQAGLSARGMAIDGRYPDWRRVIPTGEMSGVVAQFNPTFIGELAKASGMLNGRHGRRAAIGHNGTSGAVIDLGCEDFTGVLMPWRENVPEKAPAWVFEDLRVEEKAKAA